MPELLDVVHGCLPARERLARHVVDINPNCPFCDRIDETVQHLLIDCDISKSIWLAINPNIAGLGSGVNIFEWIASWFITGGSSADFNKELVKFASFTLWHIWKFRCSVVFDTAPLNISNVVSLTNQSVHECLSSNNHLTLSNHTNARVGMHIAWIRPPESFTKVNFDASFSKDSKLMGTGLIVVDDAGNWKAAGCIPRVAQGAEKAEAQAALEGIKWTVQNQVAHLQLEGDCANVVNAINSKQGSMKWTTNSIIYDCRNFFNNFNKWECYYVPRKMNEVADLLAKDAGMNSNPWLYFLISGKLDVPQ
ncbi:uncharacterized protein LOC113290823 [Papaver somniferum]|uniref:uncharacterized protein LOC113290823 n=1 Tax=Papaver somniferum TaxID=3469 RepID=UPI000E6FB4BB|nr:uncharacterized protein LOC113290823 [Papaver somniferum]